MRDRFLCAPWDHSGAIKHSKRGIDCRDWVPVGVERTLMQHSGIRTAMNIYGDAKTSEMRGENGKM